MDQAALDRCVDLALREDLDGREDVTGAVSVAPGKRAAARIIAKAAGVAAGVAAAAACFRRLDPRSRPEGVEEGAEVAPGDRVLAVEGDARALLAAERTALNFLQRLSGVATLTRAFVRAVAGTGARILDTRKTTPGLRELERRAVRAGGGISHRSGLFDQVLLKENHFALAAPLSYEDVVRRAVAEVADQAGSLPVIAEARTPDEALAAVRGGAGVVLLDNFTAGRELAEVVAAVRAASEGRPVEVEVSGGVDLGNVRAFAECGVDRISVGALTHSAPALDMSMLVEEVA